VKFDTMTVVEGKQDIGKSGAWVALCPKEEWFSDNRTAKPPTLLERLTAVQH
jgi:predicted P-loop ATPase